MSNTFVPPLQSETIVPRVEIGVNQIEFDVNRTFCHETIDMSNDASPQNQNQKAIYQEQIGIERQQKLHNDTYQKLSKYIEYPYSDLSTCKKLNTEVRKILSTIIAGLNDPVESTYKKLLYQQKSSIMHQFTLLINLVDQCYSKQWVWRWSHVSNKSKINVWINHGECNIDWRLNVEY